MDEILFEVVRFVVVVGAIAFVRYAIPLMRQFLSSEKMETVTQWAEYAVLYAQQVYKGSSGPEKKEIVTKFLREFLVSKKISITDEQLDILIESAVKSMKLAENSGGDCYVDYSDDPDEADGPDDAGCDEDGFSAVES